MGRFIKDNWLEVFFLAAVIWLSCTVLPAMLLLLTGH